MILLAEIIESPLFKELGARIDLIDAPDGLVVKVQRFERWRYQSNDCHE